MDILFLTSWKSDIINKKRTDLMFRNETNDPPFCARYYSKEIPIIGIRNKVRNPYPQGQGILLPLYELNYIMC